MNNNFVIRDVKLEDASRLSEIYSYYVENTAVTYEYKTPDAAEFEKRIQKTIEKYPYLVCEYEGKVIGYIYASSYSPREAYSWTVSSSIYIDKQYRRMGIGSALYSEIEKRLKEQGIVNIIAVVSFKEKEDEYLTQDSFLFHTKTGYKKVGHLENVGKKFERWYDIVYLQKVLK